jgi:uncharacterized protein YvpB
VRPIGSSTLLALLAVATAACAAPAPSARSGALAAAPAAAATPPAATASTDASPGVPPPSPPAAAPAPAAAAVPASFTGRVVHAPGARVRFGPGLDQPVMDVEPVGRVDRFDAWSRRADDQPQPDETTGRIEAWSRDWFHLADGRGWVHSTAVRGVQPAGMPRREWRRPGSVPAPAAGLVDAPVHRQEHPVTCEVASLLMGLAARGITTDERSLLDLVGVDPRPGEDDGAGGVARWGNPNQSFVGDPDGHVGSRTGYGVYAPPVARAAARLGAPALASGTGIAAPTLYADVLAGHPAVVWVTSDFRRGTVRTWRAWDGAAVPYALDEHAVLLVGVTPTSVLVNDPVRGPVWHPRSEFEAAYATFGGMAVVLR